MLNLASILYISVRTNSYLSFSTIIAIAVIVTTLARVVVICLKDLMYSALTLHQELFRTSHTLSHLIFFLLFDQVFIQN